MEVLPGNVVSRLLQQQYWCHSQTGYTTIFFLLYEADRQTGDGPSNPLHPCPWYSWQSCGVETQTLVWLTSHPPSNSTGGKHTVKVAGTCDQIIVAPANNAHVAIAHILIRSTFLFLKRFLVRETSFTQSPITHSTDCFQAVILESNQEGMWCEKIVDLRWRWKNWSRHTLQDLHDLACQTCHNRWLPGTDNHQRSIASIFYIRNG